MQTAKAPARAAIFRGIGPLRVDAHHAMCRRYPALGHSPKVKAISVEAPGTFSSSGNSGGSGTAA